MKEIQDFSLDKKHYLFDAFLLYIICTLKFSFLFFVLCICILYLLSLFSFYQPVHNSGSSGYGSLNSNDHLLGMSSSSESLNKGKVRQEEQEEEVSSKARPVSNPKILCVYATLHDISI